MQTKGPVVKLAPVALAVVAVMSLAAWRIGLRTSLIVRSDLFVLAIVTIPYLEPLAASFSPRRKNVLFAGLITTLAGIDFVTDAPNAITVGLILAGLVTVAAALRLKRPEVHE